MSMNMNCETVENEYRPLGLWCVFDFMINKYYWEKKGFEAAEPIRRRNLLDVLQVLQDCGVSHWVFGKTLQGILTTGELPDDHDDDVGIIKPQEESLLLSIEKKLESMGFQLIRNNEAMLSFERDFRYVDICLFQKFPRGKMGYGHKRFNEIHFSNLGKLSWNQHEVSIPFASEMLLEDMYPQNALRRMLKGIARRITFSGIVRKAKLAPRFAQDKCIGLFGVSQPVSWLARIVHVMLGGRVRKLSESEFLDLRIEPEDSFNWRWRARHLNLVTDGGRCHKMSDIIEYFKDPAAVSKVDAEVVETDTGRPFFPPTNFDMRFWWEGNSYFYYCIKYGFRKNVTPYSQVNDYIESGRLPHLFTREYYESLPVMEEGELKTFLHANPIGITNGAVTSGKHRAFAMIGRMKEGKEYIPIYTYSER